VIRWSATRKQPQKDECYQCGQLAVIAGHAAAERFLTFGAERHGFYALLAGAGASPDTLS
jgi:hypothetical protein